jgi:hypothetical protein
MFGLGAFFLRLFASGWLKRLGAALSDAFKYLVLHPMTAVALLAGLWGGWERHSATKWHHADDLAMGALSAVRTAQNQAVAIATAAKEKTDARNTQLAFDSDRSAADLHARYRAVVVQLARAQGAARRADLPGYAGGAQGSERPGASAVVPAGPGASDTIAISTSDGLICADNTARLQAVQAWAKALQSEGDVK